MKRLLAVVGCVAALVILGSFLLTDIASIPQQATEAVTVVENDDRLQLELSRQLARPPLQDSLPVADNWLGRTVAVVRSALSPFNQLDLQQSRPLIYLGVAALLGLLLGLLTRKPVPAKIPPAESAAAPEQNGLISTLRVELDERNDAIHDLEQGMARQVSAAADKLAVPLQQRIAQYEQDISIHLEDLAARDARIATQSAELEEKTWRLTELENEIAGLGEREQPLDRRLHEQADDIAQLELELSTRRGEVIALQDELAASRSRCESLEGQRAELEEQVGSLSNIVSARELELRKVQEDIDLRESDLSEWQNSVATLRDEHEALEKQRAELEDQIAGMASNDSSREHELQQLRDSLDERETELANWKDSVNSLEHEIELRAESIRELQETLAEREKHANGLRVERDGLSDTLQMLQTRLDDRQREFDVERTRLQLQAANAESELDELSRNLTLLDQKRGERDELVQELRREIEADQQQIISLETRIGDLQGQEDRMDTWQSTLDTYKSDLRARDGIIDSLRGDLSRMADTEQQVLDQQETITELELELDRQTATSQALQRELDQLGELKEVAAQRARDIELLNEQLLAVQSESDDRRGRIPPLEATLRERQGEIDQLHQDARSQAREMDELEQELADWRVKMTAMESGLRERDAGLDELRKELEASRTRLLDLDERETRLTQLQTELETASDQLETETRSRQALEAELESSRRRLDELTGLEEGLEQAKTELSMARNQLDMEARARLELESEVEEYKAVEEKLAAWDSTITTMRRDLRERQQTLDTLLNDFSLLAGGQVSANGWSAAISDVRTTLDNRERECTALRGEIERLELHAEQIEPLQHQLDEHRADLDAMRSEVERNQDAMLRADQAEITLNKNRRIIAKLKRSLKEKTVRIEDLEMETADWIDKHATLNSKHESQTLVLDQLREKFAAQRETILKLRDEKLGKEDGDDLPTLTRVIDPGDQPAKN